MVLTKLYKLNPRNMPDPIPVINSSRLLNKERNLFYREFDAYEAYKNRRQPQKILHEVDGRKILK